jgi:exosortase/archaeosortase family protein
MVQRLQLDSTRSHVPWWAGRVVLLIAIVVGAYWLSLGTLWRDLSGQTPLAFIGLSPILALGLLVAGLLRRTPLPPPGRADIAVGLPLIAAAGAIVFFAPFATSLYFWVARLDLLSLPLFVAGALILLFGWRVIFISRGALVVLLLAWPLPYLVLIENSSDFLTAVTTNAVRAVTSVIPIATEVPGSQAVFTIAYAPEPFVVQIATACAGLNSTVAFLLVGGAFTLLLVGPVRAKLVWLAAGLVIVFAFNVVRVLALLAVGATFGESAALDLFHPVAGLVALIIALVLMLAVVRRFDLAVPDLRVAPGLVATGASGRSGPPPVDGDRTPSARPMRRGLAFRSAILVVIAVLFGTANGTFAAYESGPNSVTARPLTPGSARPGDGQTAAGPRPVAPGPASPSSIGDRVVAGESEITIGRPYFGADSRWVRYRLGEDMTTARDAEYPMWLDNIRVSDRKRLIDFGVEDCYRFHGQSIDASEAVALGGGVVGRVVVTEFAKGGSTWVVLWWEWPVQLGEQTLHERIVLLAPWSRLTAGFSASQEPAAAGPGFLFDFGAAVPAEMRPLANDMASVATRIVSAQLAGTAVAQ